MDQKTFTEEVETAKRLLVGHCVLGISITERHTSAMVLHLSDGSSVIIEPEFDEQYYMRSFNHA
jgi:hypothetical protein